MEPLTPFQIPSWTSPPDDAELVKAIVGPTGTDNQRADAEAIARDLLLPRLAWARHDVKTLRFELENGHSIYNDMFRREALGDELLRFAVFEAISDVSSRASALATVRLRTVLWPSGTYPETWRDDDKVPIDPATVQAAALALHDRMLEIEGRYASRLPIVFSRGEVALTNNEFGQHRNVVLARNQIHVALTGDYSVTTGWLYDELTAHGFETTTVLENRPY